MPCRLETQTILNHPFLITTCEPSLSSAVNKLQVSRKLKWSVVLSVFRHERQIINVRSMSWKKIHVMHSYWLHAQGRAYSLYLPITFPFPLKIKQEHCFCVIVVPPLKGDVLFEKFATVFKYKISFSESLSSKNTLTFKERKNKTPYQYFSSTIAAYYILNQKLLFWKVQQSCEIILC